MVGMKLLQATESLFLVSGITIFVKSLVTYKESSLYGLLNLFKNPLIEERQIFISKNNTTKILDII